MHNLFQKENGTIIIEYINIDKLNRNAMLGYCIDENYQKQGIMSECCQKIIDFGFKELNLHRIDLRIAPENFRSKALARRLNFKSEGLIKEAYLLNGSFTDYEIFGLIKPYKGN